MNNIVLPWEKSLYGRDICYYRMNDNIFFCGRIIASKPSLCEYKILIYPMDKTSYSNEYKMNFASLEAAKDFTDKELIKLGYKLMSNEHMILL